LAGTEAVAGENPTLGRRSPPPACSVWVALRRALGSTQGRAAGQGEPAGGSGTVKEPRTK